MNIHRLVSPFAFALFLALLPNLFNLEVQAQEQGWALTQRSEALGDQYIYVSTGGFKWQNPKSGANIVSTAPGWGVTMYNDKSRAYFQTTFAEWQKQVAARKGGDRAEQMQNSAWSKAGSGNIAGLKATKYVMRGGSQPLTGGKRTLAQVQSATCWIADEIEIPAPLAEMLSAAYGMPRTKYFPLKVTYQSNGANKVALDTYHCKTCPIPGNFYSYPGGYTLAGSQAEVLIDDETRQILQDLAGELDDKPTQRQQVAPQRARPAPTRAIAAPQIPKKDPLGSLLDSLQGKGSK